MQLHDVMADLILNILLASIAIAVLVSFWRFHSDPKYKDFNALDIITNNEGKLSRPAIMEFGAFVIMTWGYVFLLNKGGLSEWYAGLYVGAFVIRGGWSSYLNASKNGNGHTTPTKP